MLPVYAQLPLLVPNTNNLAADLRSFASGNVTESLVEKNSNRPLGSASDCRTHCLSVAVHLYSLQSPTSPVLQCSTTQLIHHCCSISRFRGAWWGWYDHTLVTVKNTISL